MRAVIIGALVAGLLVLATPAASARTIRIPASAVGHPTVRAR
jgi:hypothetical protein